jgi:hypothetical protein
MGVNQELHIDLVITEPYEDTFEIPPTADNTPPTYADPDEDPNPDGTPGVHLHGACAAEMVDYGATGVSRLGPWGGLSTLTPESLLAGGAPPASSDFILNGGAAIPGPVTTTAIIEAAN